MTTALDSIARWGIVLLILSLGFTVSSVHAQPIDKSEFIVEGMESPVVRVIEGAIRRVEREPGSFQRWYDLGATLDAHEILEGASRYYKKAIELNPKHIPSLYNGGLVLEYLGDSSAAKETWDVILALQPDHTLTNFRVGEYYFRNGELEPSLSCFQKFMKGQPNSSMGFSRLGSVLLQLQKPAEALEMLKKALISTPGDRPTLVALSQAYLRSGNREKATEIQKQLADDESIGEKLILTDPLRAEIASRAINSNTCISRAESLEDQGLLASALVEYSTAAIGQPNNSVLHNRIGKLYVRLGIYPDAEEHFTRAIEINSEYFDAFHNRGVAREHLNKLEKAIEDYRKVLEMEPEHPLSTARLKILGEL